MVKATLSLLTTLDIISEAYTNDSQIVQNKMINFLLIT